MNKYAAKPHNQGVKCAPFSRRIAAKAATVYAGRYIAKQTLEFTLTFTAV